jgi:hypothetical protein
LFILNIFVPKKKNQLLKTQRKLTLYFGTTLRDNFWGNLNRIAAMIPGVFRNQDHAKGMAPSTGAFMLAQTTKQNQTCSI